MKLSIRTALVGGFLGLQLVPVSVILASSYLTSQQVLLGHARDIMENIATFAIHEAQGYLRPAQDAARLTQRLADSEVVSSRNREALERYFYEQLALHSNFAGIYLGSPSGEFVYVSRMDTKVTGGYRTKIIRVQGGARTVELVWKDQQQREIGRELDPSDTYDPRTRPWYAKARDVGRTVWTAPYVFFTSKKPGLTAASPAFDANGNLSGVVGVDIEIDQISTFLAQLRIGKNGRAFILDRDGAVVAFPDSEKIKRPTGSGDGTFRLTTITELDDVLSREAFESLGRPDDRFDIDAPVFGSFSHGGERYHTMFAPFSNPQWPWVIGIYLPEDDYLGPIKQNRLQNLWVVLGLGALASVVGLVIARSVVRPMTAFQAEALAVKDEDLESTFDKHSAIKEIQESADCFTAMKEGLKNTRARNAELARGLQEYAAELAAKEMHLRATFTSLVNFSDALVILDPERRVRFVNPAAEILLGVAGPALLGNPFPYPTSGESPAEVEIQPLRRPRTVLEVRVVETEWEGQSARLVALRDVTERRVLESEIRWRADTLAALHEIAVELARQRALPELLRTIAERATGLLQAKGAGVFLYHPEEDALEAVLWHGLESGIGESRVRRGEGVTGKVLDSGHSLLIDDYGRWAGRLPAHRTSSFNACVAAPIQWGPTALGVLLVGDDSPRTFHPADLELLERFTPLAAAALEQQRLLEQARRDAETKSVLLKEVNHRVKNNLSAIIGLLYAERRAVASERRDTIQDLIHRVQGLATVHHLLSASEWSPVRVTELASRVIDSVLQTLPSRSRVSTEVSPSSLRIVSAQANALAMVVNELAMNAVKHALPGRGDGALHLAVSADADDGDLSLEFRDDGPGFPDDVFTSQTDGTGLYLVQRLVTTDLAGSLHLRNENGAVAVIRFPLAAGNPAGSPHETETEPADRGG